MIYVIHNHLVYLEVLGKIKNQKQMYEILTTLVFM